MSDLSQEVRDAIRQMIETDVVHLPDQLGIDHITPGCLVTNVDTYGVGVGVLPRYITVKINEYNLQAFYRGGIPTLAVGEYVSVAHLSEGNRYEVFNASGTTGIIATGHTPRAWLSETLPYMDFAPDKPAVVTTAGVVTEYATIVAALAAANAGDSVVIPPGTYNESITLKTGVFVVELFPGTVTINSTSANVAVTCANGGYIQVKEISVTRNINAPVIAVYANNVPTGGNICTVLAETITATNASAGAASYAIGIYPNTLAGTLYVYAKRMVITGSKYAYGVMELTSSGILEIFIDSIAVSGANTSYVVRLTTTTTLTCNMYNGKYALVGSGAVACYGIYNGSGTVSLRSCDLSVTSAGDAYGLYGADAGTTTFDSVNVYAYTAAGTAYGEITNHASAVLNHRHGRSYAQGSTNGYGITCTLGTVRVTSATAYGNTTDLVRSAGTFSIASVQYDTYSGTIVLTDESIHALIAEVDDTTELTIAAGVITITQSYHRVDTQGDAASDDLDTINGGVIGRLLFIRPEDGARTVVVKHNTGNIWLLGKVDVSLDDVNDHILLIYDGTKWCSVDEDGGGGGAAGAWMAIGGGGAMNFEPDMPATVSTAGVVTEYATIAAALAGAVAGDTVVIPPGTYDESITLVADVRVVELSPGTVVINSTSADVAVTTAAGGYIHVTEIRATRTNNNANAVYSSHNSGTCVVVAELIRSEVTGTGGSYGVYHDDIGTLWIIANRVQASGGTVSTEVVFSDAGTVYVSAIQLLTEDGTSGWSIAAECAGGSQYIWGECRATDDTYAVGAEGGATGRQEIWGDCLAITAEANAYALGAEQNGEGTQIIHGNCHAEGVDAAYGAYLYANDTDNATQTVYGHCYAIVSAGAGASYGAWIQDSTQDAVQEIWGNAIATGGSTSIGAITNSIAAGGGVAQRINGDVIGGVYGAECNVGTQTITNGRAMGGTTDLRQVAGTLQITSVQYDTYSGTILLLTESTHSLISELEDTAELTIAAGVIAVTQSYHRVDTQGDAATDDLDTINGGVTGRLLVLRPEDGARTVVVKHNTGNIWIKAAADVMLDDIHDHLMLIYDGSAWCDL